MSRLLRNPMVNPLLHNKQLLVLIPSQLTTIHTSLSNSFKLTLILSPLTRMALSIRHLSDFPTKILYILLYPFTVCPSRRTISHKKTLSVLLLTNSTLLTAASLPEVQKTPAPNLQLCSPFRWKYNRPNPLLVRSQPDPTQHPTLPLNEMKMLNSKYKNMAFWFDNMKFDVIH
jgi:hypothetical protein